MCAISGMIGFKGKLKKITDECKKNILKTMARRGPDQDGIFETENAMLFHARLSVIDPENGLQPMTAYNSGNKFTIVYNGEIYNCDELRNELKTHGVEFETSSDTEVLLKMFITYGENCVSKLNGIFAFAVWDEKSQKLFIARDKMGVKPFFFTIKDENFIFSSEIKTLFEYPEVKPEIDIKSISELILTGPGRTPGYGIFCGINELMPAQCGYYTSDGLKTWDYWQIHDKIHTDSTEETISHIRYLVTDSIRRQLVSDVPIGTFLSGGLDSSLISSVASQYMKERGETLTAFSVTYRDNDKYFTQSKFQPNSDTEYIEIMKKYLECNHEQITIDTPQLVDALFDAVEARDLPGMADVDSSLLLFCKEVKKHCTVALSGECADEIFGGYPWYRDKTISRQKGFPWAQTTDWRASFIKNGIAEKIDAEKYVFDKYNDTVTASDVLDSNCEDDKYNKLMMNLNIKWFMQTLLDRKDRMSMYSGLEVRVPFCDERIVEYLYSVPWALKDYKGYEKGLLREAVQGLLPDEVLWRKKSPYPKTHNPAYLSAVSELLNDVLASHNEPIFNIVNKEQLKVLLKSESQIPWYGQLMTIPQTIAYFLQLNYWLKKFKPTILID